MVRLRMTQHLASRKTGMLSVALGAGIAAAVALGPLGLRRIALHTSEHAKQQFLGGEIVTLGIVAPLAIAGGVLTIRRHPLGPVLALGPALYAIYTYASVIAGQEYGRYPGNAERYLPLYAGLIGAGALVARQEWRAFSTTPLPAISHRLRQNVALSLGSLGAFFALSWTAQIAAVFAGRASNEYYESPRLFWTIKTLDCGLVIPASLATAIGLLRYRPWALRAAYAAVPFATCMVASVAGMAAAMERSHDPSAQPIMLAATVPVSVLFAGLSCALIRRLLHEDGCNPGDVSNLARRSIAHR